MHNSIPKATHGSTSLLGHFDGLQGLLSKKWLRHLTYLEKISIILTFPRTRAISVAFNLRGVLRHASPLLQKGFVHQGLP